MAEDIDTKQADLGLIPYASEKIIQDLKIVSLFPAATEMVL